MSFNISLSNSKTQEIIGNILKGQENLLIPICGEIAYLDCKVISKEKCNVHIGGEYYIQTNIGRVKDILSRKNNRENQKNPVENKNLTKLDDNTFEIMENEDESLSNNETKQNEAKKKEEEEQQQSIMISNKLIKSEEKQEKLNEPRELKPKSGRQVLLDLIERIKGRTKDKESTPQAN